MREDESMHGELEGEGLAREGLAREGPDPVDWQGTAIACAMCRFRARLDLGQCGQGWACVHDRYAKRIERFFLLNPDLADMCLSHPYFETRMNAARVASVFRLTRLLVDEDAGVRAMAILRLPRAHAERKIKDPDRGVRIAVAHRMPVESLIAMAADEDSYVRSIVARRAEVGMLPVMWGDADPDIRRIVARRIDTQWLDRFHADPDPLVRREAALRRPGLFVFDADMRVRHAVAEEGEADDLRQLMDDDEDIIRETAAARLAEITAQLAAQITEGA